MHNVERYAIGALIVAAMVVGSAPIVRAQTPITTCGQEVSGDSVLANDLDCAPTDPAAVVQLGGHLNLNGHTIRGGQFGVLCASPSFGE